MKLTYNATRTITTADLGLACDPPLVFEVRVRVDPSWARLHLQWEEGGADDTDMACELVGKVFVNVGQDGKIYPIEGKEGAEDLRASIEESSPGEGDAFICHLALRFGQDHFRFLARNSAAYAELSRPLNGSKSEKAPVEAS